MGERPATNIRKAIELIESSTTKSRTDGIADLKHLFRYNDHSQTIEGIKNKEYHRIFEALFKCAATERKAYLGATKDILKNGAANRLSSCAATFRIVVEASVSKLKSNTVKALLQHIIDILPHPEGDHCDPLVTDYAKAMRAILEHQSHVEHLCERWKSILDFCLDAIRIHYDAIDVSTSITSNGHSSANTLNASMGRATKSFTSQAGNRMPTTSNPCADFVMCVRWLVQAANAPIRKQGSAILSAMTDYLRSAQLVGRGHQDALIAVNSVLARIANNHGDIARIAIQDLVPIIKELWSNKRSTMREEMLTTLIYSEAHIESLMSEAVNVAFRIDVENLLEAILTEYSKRPEKDMLQLDDISIRDHENTRSTSAAMRLSAFSLDSMRSENQWTVLYFVARLSSAFDRFRTQEHKQDLESEPDSPNKKPKWTSSFDDYLRRLSHVSASQRVCYLQVLSFMLSESRCSVESISNVLERLPGLFGDTNPAVLSWAMLCLAGCLYKSNAISPSLAEPWVVIWKTVARSVSVVSSCRAACHLLDKALDVGVVKYASVSSVVDGMFAFIDFNGPVLLCESSLGLWTSLIKSRLSENPSNSKDTIGRILRWLFNKWTPSNFQDRAHLVLGRSHYRANDISFAILSWLGLSHEPEGTGAFTSLGPLSQAFMRTERTEALSDYLLLRSLSRPRTQNLERDMDQQQPTSAAAMGLSTGSDASVIEFLLSETEKVRTLWENVQSERPKSITPDVLRAVVPLVLVNSCLISKKISKVQRRLDELQKLNDLLTRAIASYLSRADTEEEKLDTVLSLIAAVLRPPSQLRSLHPDVFSNSGALPLALRLFRAIEDRRNLIGVTTSNDGIDLMDIDSEFESQESNGIQRSKVVVVARDDISAPTIATSCKESLTAYLQLITSSFEASTIDDSTETIPAAFFKRLQDVSPFELYSCGAILTELANSSLRVSWDDGSVFLEHLANAILANYEFSGCEGAIVFVLEVLRSMVLDWAAPGADADNVGSQLYDWVLKIADDDGFEVLSPQVQMRFANLCSQLIRVRPNYPRARTTVFQLLLHGEIPVKHHIAALIPDIFSRWVLSEHDTVFKDLQKNSLPGDLGWKEGIAMRLFILSELAARWQTLLRRCIYHIFETAGVVPESMGYASICMSQIARKLGLRDTQSLFRLFAPQLLYTWLEKQDEQSQQAQQSIKTIPYAVFSYESLKALLTDVEDEAVAQLLMRAQDDEFNELISALSKSPMVATTEAFSKAIAYAISWDLGSRQEATKSGESRIIAILTKDKYMNLIRHHFHEIVGVIFSTTERMDGLEKALAKNPSTSKQLRRLEDIKHFSCSKTQLPAEQQPSFPSKYLYDQLSRISRRALENLDDLWSPDRYVFALRMLLTTMDPALGSLHACACIRKIRALVALAGDVVLNGYPLEATIHCLRPFLTIQHCADDTLGIVQYLYDHGKAYLQTRLSFVAGSSVATLLAINEFLGSKQESTTQGSQYEATMKQAEVFHRWLSTYLRSLTSKADLASKAVGTEAKRFAVLIEAASSSRGSGNAISGSPEGTLLLQIFKDSRSTNPLLDGPSRELINSRLQQTFESLPDMRSDMLYAENDATANIEQVWESLSTSSERRNYALWAGRALGRAFDAMSAPADVTKRLKANRDATDDRAVEWDDDDDAARDPILASKTLSKTFIVRKIFELLRRDDQNIVGCAEEALRKIIERTISKDAEGRISIERALPDVVQIALLVPQRITDKSSPWDSNVRQYAVQEVHQSTEAWICGLTVALAATSVADSIVGALPEVLLIVPGLAEILFPRILHLALLRDFDKDRSLHSTISDLYHKWFANYDDTATERIRILLTGLSYLRKQPYPYEATYLDRNEWVEIDHVGAAQAALRCGMSSLALLLAETCAPPTQRISRRSSVQQTPTIPHELLLGIYERLDEPDSFYGVQQDFGLDSVLARFDYERDGYKSLIFRGARLDSQMRRENLMSPDDTQGIVRSLMDLNLNSLTHVMLSSSRLTDTGGDMLDSSLVAARKLQQWDLRAPDERPNEAAITFDALQAVANATTLADIRNNLDSAYLKALTLAKRAEATTSSIHRSLQTLAIISEIDEVLSCSSREMLEDTWLQLSSRHDFIDSGRFENVQPVLSARQTLFSVLASNECLRSIVHASPKDLRGLELQSLLSACALARQNGASKESLAAATYLNDIVPECRKIGLRTEATAQYEVAQILWDQGETHASVRTLQQILSSVDLNCESLAPSSSAILAKLAHHVAEARLEKPQEIIDNYLSPAIEELENHGGTPQASEVFHEFASFCDRQLQNPDAKEDFTRVQDLCKQRHEEADGFSKASKASKNSREKHQLNKRLRETRKWLQLDEDEFNHLWTQRQTYIKMSLQNYLKSLEFSDHYDNDVLRFIALWLEFANLNLANSTVEANLSRVPSGKLVPIMNQLSSRLQSDGSHFQKLLADLVFRICKDHPYHGMYQVNSGTSSAGIRDEAAKSRQAAANKVSALLKADSKAGTYWKIIRYANGLYHDAAVYRDKDEFQAGKDYPLEQYAVTQDLAKKIPTLRVPPATIHIDVRGDCNYKKVPTIAHFKPKMKIASGLSAPKIITAVATNGKSYKQLLKGSQDDLRQDAIMEQVFEQVSKLLRRHPATQRRNLHVRTYKVIPLTAVSGIIDFVPNTLPLQDLLLPMHEKYHPKDLRHANCRHKVASAAEDSNEARIKAFKEVCEKFSPAMRFWFLEKFLDPDDWFEKRLAYTRSVAANSILGHILGLGDRHLHNILVDSGTGEVVNIDLGIAFEGGRVLPVPEIIPFRLTRDLVDGMGYTKAEGVFRRCCEFTLDALREERESIMTILNVLRYDPLCNWTVSPTKARKIQDAHNDDDDGETVDEIAEQASKKKDDDVGEAGRALAVVEKKLAKSLSSAATVNELIQQATDERNLALLFNGWSAWV